jgi:hypothetical protein
VYREQLIPTPEFPVRSSKKSRVCGFQLGKPHEVRRPHSVLQEIRVAAFPQEKPHFAAPTCAEEK